ncbi:hypothetical protein CRU96_05700 [Malaciobacter halophilus]|nr:hypothetical protein [Malaciobacter halophilus]RYA23901.1 hypothetical protein CRU96_05700 [Malaciobacter halophilus]
MAVEEMIETDLAACSEFGGTLTHTLDLVEEQLEYLYFEEETEVILEKGEYEGATAFVPMVAMQTSVAAGVGKKSLLTIDGEVFGVIYPDKQNDGTTKIYLER